MMARDVLFYSILVVPVILVVYMFMLVSAEPADGEEAFDAIYLYGPLVVVIGIDIGLVYWRWSVYSSILNSGVEVPGEVTSVTRSGDTVMVEYTYRWQAETIKSTHKIGGYIPKRRIKEEVGLKATLLVDPSKPTRFLVLDSVR